MRSITALILFLIIFLPNVYAAEPTTALEADAARDARFIQASREIHWRTVTPLDYLNVLKGRNETVMFIEDIHKPPPGWITEEDVGQLMRLIKSAERCAPVVSESSPYLPSSSSTVGNEAMYLIEGFRAKRYPPTLCSVYDFKPDPAEYKRWWAVLTEGVRTKKTGIGVKVIRTIPTRDEIVKDSKPADLSIIDGAYLKRDTLRIGTARAEILANRITNKVEYVWSPPYKRFVPPRYVMPNAQKLYDQRPK